MGIDAVGHGDRLWDDFDERFEGSADEIERAFIGVVRDSAAELPKLIDALIERGLARERVGIAGISMGGYIAYAAVLADRRVACIAAISGSPEWKIDSDASPLQSPHRFAPVAVLSQIGARDPIVDPRGARELHRKLEPYYLAAPERVQLVEYSEGDHLLAAQWSELWERALEWFGRFLGK